MQLLIIRHGTAEDSAPGGDAKRSLTNAGKQEMKEIAAGLKTIVDSVDVIAASPLLRAQQTAEIVAKEYGNLRIQTVEALVPGSVPDAFAQWLSKYSSAEVAAAVGHEPLLGLLVTWFMTGAGNSRVELSKGGAALIEFHSRLSAGSGTLRWLLTRSQLRRLR